MYSKDTYDSNFGGSKDKKAIISTMGTANVLLKTNNKPKEKPIKK